MLVEKNRPSLVKWCAIAGLVLAEIYMVITVASPRLKGIEIPATAVAMRIMAMSLLFGPFGLAVGTGIGLLLDALRRTFAKPPTPRPDQTPLPIDAPLPLPAIPLSRSPDNAWPQNSQLKK